MSYQVKNLQKSFLSFLFLSINSDIIFLASGFLLMKKLHFVEENSFSISIQYQLFPNLLLQIQERSTHNLLFALLKLSFFSLVLFNFAKIQQSYFSTEPVSLTLFISTDETLKLPCLKFIINFFFFVFVFKKKGIQIPYDPSCHRYNIASCT